MSKKTTDWQEVLRIAIRKSGMTLKDIATKAGVDHSQLSRFMRAERNITFPTAEKVGTLLGLELKLRRKS